MMPFVPRLVIGAPHGRSGKTTVAVGLLASLISEKGLTVQPFKKGPDFIDPGWLSRVAGRECRNLDSFLMDRENILASFLTYTAGADLGIVEGAMGLYDGVDLQGSGSTAEIAKIIRAPVVLVVDCTRMTRSVAAVVMGFLHFDPDLKIAGVILNKVARPRHEEMLRAALQTYCGVPVLGAIPKGEKLCIPDRHLGLVPVAENAELVRKIREIGQAASKYLDLDALLKAAADAPALEEKGLFFANPLPVGKVKIGIFKDRAFTFYYPENLEALEACGAEIVAIDSLRDPFLPAVDALYLGGGFPEIFAAELEANAGLRSAVRKAVEDGLPVYAECGGLMYLARELKWQNKTYRMAGALPFDVLLADRPQGHGYEIIEAAGENPFVPVGATIKAHEFHHSRVINLDRSRVRFAFRVLRGWGIDGLNDGLVYKNVLAAYAHIHALATPDWARWLVAKAAGDRSTHSRVITFRGLL
ncbi:MAG: hydrogenobyrinic acid a,c-diamide synthase (glutamine-hydrolyzing) [Armatimonadetes bacterium]|nr:hydrogenobyrinic acid a,c-diamide synthase (glutamine-hydrolyzing) [Armatimonadota bacterium]